MTVLHRLIISVASKRDKSFEASRETHINEHPSSRQPSLKTREIMKRILHEEKGIASLDSLPEVNTIVTISWGLLLHLLLGPEQHPVQAVL